MNVFSIVLLFLIAFLLVVLMRRSASNSPGTLGLNAGNTVNPVKQSRKHAPMARNPYRATSILLGEAPCDAVKANANKRFLDADRITPTLPLPDCDAANCTCKYAHHEDRRETQEDRRHPNTLQSELYGSTGNTNRRNRKRGRRKTDWA
jgi:hypothetical protein